MRTFTWTVEIEVTETWVADGFNLTQDRLQSIVAAALPFARWDEFAVRILRRPTEADVRHAQGLDHGVECQHVHCEACYGPEGYHRDSPEPRYRKRRGAATESVRQS